MILFVYIFFVFFFSSRRRHTRCGRDWSSDVCSSDLTYCDYNAFLTNGDRLAVFGAHDVTNILSYNWQSSWLGDFYLPTNSARSEERRVGKECRSGWST